MAIYKTRGRHGVRWHYVFRYKGRRYKGSAGAKATEQDTKDMEATRRREVIDTKIHGPRPKPVTFADFAGEFLQTETQGQKTKERGVGIIEMLKLQWSGLNLDAISPKMIEDYKARRMKVRAAATVYKELQVIKRLFRKAGEWGRLQTNPAAIVKKPRVNNNRVRFLESDEMDRLMKAVPDWLLPYVIFARFTGARRGEMLRIIWTDVDFKRGLLTFRDTKTGEDATVAINGTVRRLLESPPRPIDRSQKVFPLEDNSAGWEKIKWAWRKACSEAKITGFRWHNLRHQAATDLLDQGANLNDVRDFLRHKTMNMTLRYAHLIKSRREQTACLLDRLGVGPETAPETVAGS